MEGVKEPQHKWTTKRVIIQSSQTQNSRGINSANTKFNHGKNTAQETISREMPTNKTKKVVLLWERIYKFPSKNLELESIKRTWEHI